MITAIDGHYRGPYSCTTVQSDWAALSFHRDVTSVRHSCSCRYRSGAVSWLSVDPDVFVAAALLRSLLPCGLAFLPLHLTPIPHAMMHSRRPNLLKKTDRHFEPVLGQ